MLKTQYPDAAVSRDPAGGKTLFFLSGAARRFCPRRLFIFARPRNKFKNLFPVRARCATGEPSELRLFYTFLPSAEREREKAAVPGILLHNPRHKKLHAPRQPGRRILLREQRGLSLTLARELIRFCSSRKF